MAQTRIQGSAAMTATGTLDRPETQTEPLRLSDAVTLGFPHGGMTVSGLRREASHGRLVIFKIAGKDFTTLADIEGMKELCRAEAKARVSGSSQPANETMERSSAPSGSSAMVRS